MKTLKDDIQKELEEFDKEWGDNLRELSNSGLLAGNRVIEHFKQSLERIANKTAKALEVEEKNVSPYENRLEQQVMWTDIGYNQAVQEQKENKDKYLK